MATNCVAISLGKTTTEQGRALPPPFSTPLSTTLPHPYLSSAQCSFVKGHAHTQAASLTHHNNNNKSRKNIDGKIKQI